MYTLIHGIANIYNRGFSAWTIRCINRYNTYLPLKSVPDKNGTSHTTSIEELFKPITTPFAHNGTPPESCTMVTRSPKANRWFCNLYMACEGFNTACRGMPLTIAFLIEDGDRFALKLSASFSISVTVAYMGEGCK